MVAFYIDSADRADVTRLLSTGLFRGVTTNPAILDKAGLGSRDIPDLIAWAVEAGAEQVFAQVWGASAGEMIERGLGFRALSDRVVVKVPMSPAGVEAARALSAAGDVLVTAVHSAAQVLPIAASGARFAATFVGRMDAADRNGIAEAIAAHRALVGVGAATEIFAGSLRTPEQMLELAAAGIRHMTFGPAVWDLFFADGVTGAAVAHFEELASAVAIA